MKPVIMHDEAEAELDEAARYHERRRKGYGKRLRAEFKAVVRRIRQNPKAFPTYGAAGHRKALFKTFSYTIYFAEVEEVIWIGAIAHQSRQPGYWLDRTPF
jgi:plasmid stabilization system protein ParE